MNEVILGCLVGGAGIALYIINKNLTQIMKNQIYIYREIEKLNYVNIVDEQSDNEPESNHTPTASSESDSDDSDSNKSDSDDSDDSDSEERISKEEEIDILNDFKCFEGEPFDKVSKYASSGGFGLLVLKKDGELHQNELTYNPNMLGVEIKTVDGEHIVEKFVNVGGY